MKIVSWNVNGIRASLSKGLPEFIKQEKADIYCFQETKASTETEGIAPLELLEYQEYWHHAGKKGYSGTMVLTKIEPLSATFGMGKAWPDNEGRVITLELNSFYLINVYFPNAGKNLERLNFKLEFNDHLMKHIQKLRKEKPVVLTGDFNVSHKEVDIARPKSNRGRAGFTDEERAWFDKLLEKEYIDSFRKFTEEGGHYTWWSYMHNARAKNIGWRLDYFVISGELRSNLQKSDILSEVLGSDHCPIRLVIG
ncbi:MAG: exodeoxyribonuclease III [Candidatus Thorarchaeota archaeon]|nr:exodeoxyribonuclease III [Candidatus Thorarchaeota archaeon]